MKQLDALHSLEQLKQLNKQELSELCQDIRDMIIDVTLKNGGHLSSNLGVVEMTVALLRTFDVPKDKIIFDVGHQSYTYKILTGRKDQFDTLRTKGGLSGFPKTSESEYDAFDTGHASTAISAGLGLVRARDVLGQRHHVVSVVGDGALSGGLCYEALDDGGQGETPFIVILNDNHMSISKSVGSISQYLSKLRTGKAYRRFKKHVQKSLEAIPLVGHKMAKGVERFKNRVKFFLLPNVFFEEMGFTYIGPVDGHDISRLCALFDHAKTLNRPCFLHLITTKGKGYVPAESNPEKYHGVAPYRVEKPGNERKHSNSCIVGRTLCALAEKDRHIAAVTAAMPSSTGLGDFAKQYPNRFFDVGIAEEHAITMSAGLAKGGLRPFFAVYSTFLQRGFDQIIHDVCLQNLAVVLCIDRAGLVGEDGDTHQGIFDLAMLLPMPNLQLFVPATQRQLANMVAFAAQAHGPVAIRYPRTSLPEEEPLIDQTPLSCWTVFYPIAPLTLVATGSTWTLAKKAAERLEPTMGRVGLVHAGCLKPMDQDVVNQLATCKLVVTLEEGVVQGGFGHTLLTKLNALGPAEVISFGVPDRFVSHGSIAQLWEDVGLTEDAILEAVRQARIQDHD